jgi:hypothetical protein
VDLVRFGKNLLFAVVLFLILASIHRVDWPVTQRFEEYITFVLTTEYVYDPLVQLTQRFTIWDGGGGVRGWLDRWRGFGETVFPAGGLADPGALGLPSSGG